MSLHVRSNIRLRIVLKNDFCVCRIGNHPRSAQYMLAFKKQFLINNSYQFNISYQFININ